MLTPKCQHTTRLTLEHLVSTWILAYLSAWTVFCMISKETECFKCFKKTLYRENKLQIQYSPIKILCVFLACFQKSGVHACVYFCLGHQLNSTDIHVCFCVNTMLFLLLRFVVKLDVGDGDTSSSSFSIQVYFSFSAVCVCVCVSI